MTSKTRTGLILCVAWLATATSTPAQEVLGFGGVLPPAPLPAPPQVPGPFPLGGPQRDAGLDLDPDMAAAQVPLETWLEAYQQIYSRAHSQKYRLDVPTGSPLWHVEDRGDADVMLAAADRIRQELEPLARRQLQEIAAGEARALARANAEFPALRGLRRRADLVRGLTLFDTLLELSQARRVHFDTLWPGDEQLRALVAEDNQPIPLPPSGTGPRSLDPSLQEDPRFVEVADRLLGSTSDGLEAARAAARREADALEREANPGGRGLFGQRRHFDESYTQEQFHRTIQPRAARALAALIRFKAELNAVGVVLDGLGGFRRLTALEVSLEQRYPEQVREFARLGEWARTLRLSHHLPRLPYQLAAGKLLPEHIPLLDPAAEGDEPFVTQFMRRNGGLATNRFPDLVRLQY